jgi:hypothetical protein
MQIKTTMRCYHLKNRQVLERLWRDWPPVHTPVRKTAVQSKRVEFLQKNGNQGLREISVPTIHHSSTGMKPT